MKKMTMLIVILVALATCCHSERLVFEDNFDTLDMSKWTHEVSAWGGGNGEFQVYTSDKANSYTRNGVLYMTPTMLKDNINPLTGQPFGEDFLYEGTLDLWAMYGTCTNEENWGCHREGKYGIIPPTMSSKLVTKNKFSFKYGRLEVEAKLPAGDWIWPAIWLMPEHHVYGWWPRSGEIDLMESIGNRDLKSWDGHWLGIQRTGSTLHWGMQKDDNRFYFTQVHKTNVDNNYADSFHKYTMIWSPNGFQFMVDGEQFAHYPHPMINEHPGWSGWYNWGAPWWSTNENPWAKGTNMAPFDQEFYLMLNVAVGGTGGFIPDGAVNQGGRANKPWHNNDHNAAERFWWANGQWGPTWQGENAAMQIKSIRVYQD